MKQTFKDRLKILMRESGETKPYSWAKKMGIKMGLFQYYWQAGKVPTMENLLKIQNFTGCSLDWLLTGRNVTHEGRFSGLSLKSNNAETGTVDLALLEDLELLKKIRKKYGTSGNAHVAREVLKALAK